MVPFDAVNIRRPMVRLRRMRFAYLTLHFSLNEELARGQ